MPTFGDITISSDSSNKVLAGRSNFLLKKALPTHQYTDFSRNITQTIDLADKNIVAAMLSITLDPQTEPLPVYFNLIDSKDSVDSVVIFPTYFEVSANNALVMSTADATVLTDSGHMDIPTTVTSLSISMTTYFLDEYPDKLVFQFIKEKLGASTMLATLNFFTDILTTTL